MKINPKLGVVRSRDLILKCNVKVDNKTTNINVNVISLFVQFLPGNSVGIVCMNHTLV